MTDASIKTYVVDTSVLLSDPRALTRFAEHEVVLPLVVITELEAKRTHPELGYFARQALRLLDDLRVDHGRLDLPLAVGDRGGTLRVELNHSDSEVLPPGFRLGDNDSRILAVALSLSHEGRDVVLVTKDVPLRVKAGALGLVAEEYRAELVITSGWTGVVEVSVPSDCIDALYADGVVELEPSLRPGIPPVSAANGEHAATSSGSDSTNSGRDEELVTNAGVVLLGDRSSALGRVLSDKRIRLVRGDLEAFGVHGRSAEQRLALDALLDPSIGIVSLGGRAGTGKSALALAAGLEWVLERGGHSKLMVFRPLYAVGGQDLGYLPGSEHEKMSPWGQAVFDTLTAITTRSVIDEIVSRDMLEVLPLTHVRGRSLHDAFVIVDEAQSLERNVLLTVLSRIGKDARVVLTHDIAQSDNLRVGRYDGVVAVIEKLKGHPLFAHVTLTRPERSAIAALVTDLLEDPPR